MTSPHPNGRVLFPRVLSRPATLQERDGIRTHRDRHATEAIVESHAKTSYARKLLCFAFVTSATLFGGFPKTAIADEGGVSFWVRACSEAWRRCRRIRD